MEFTLRSFIFLFLLFSQSVLISEAVLEIEEVGYDQPYETWRIQSEGYPLKPGDDSIDKLWIVYSSIRIDINHMNFQLDGQNGDFMLISEVPMLNPWAIVNPIDDLFGQSILTDQGLLLSWQVNKTIQIHSDNEVFIYFHAEKVTQQSQRNFNGFDILIRNFDSLRTTTTTMPPQTSISPPTPGEEVYISRYLECNEPQKFLSEINLFKQQVAKMATEYCIENNITDDAGPFNISEVNIPDPGGVHYCDITWSVYSTCVEVTFAITRISPSTGYIMGKTRLEEMWDNNLDNLKANNFCPYTPPDPSVDINSWVWIASILGVILGFSTVLCFVWLRRTQHEYKKSSTFATKEPEEDTESIRSGFFDPKNPIYGVLKKLKKTNKDDAKYLEIQINGQLMGESGGGQKLRTNAMFQIKDDALDFDNHGYQEEEMEFDTQTNPMKEVSNRIPALLMTPRLRSSDAQSDTSI